MAAEPGPYRFSGNKMTFEVKSAQVGLFPFKFALPLNITGPSKGRSNGALQLPFSVILRFWHLMYRV